MISQDQYLANVFPEPPLTAFRRQNNIRNILIKSKVPNPPKLHPERNIKGMLKCGKACTACPFINQRKTVKINKNTIWKINNKYTCESFNIIYLIECNIDNCKERYIGQSKLPLKFRLAQHRGYITNQVTSKSTGAHFNLPGHGVANLTITILEQAKKNSEEYRKEREKYLIRKFNTFNEGLNRQI